MQEQDLDEDGLPKEGADPDVLREKYKDARLRELEETLDIDPSIYYAFTMDLMRVDVGLLIQRPPIFLRMRDQDAEFVKDRSSLMNEYWIDNR